MGDFPMGSHAHILSLALIERKVMLPPETLAAWTKKYADWTRNDASCTVYSEATSDHEWATDTGPDGEEYIRFCPQSGEQVLFCLPGTTACRGGELRFLHIDRLFDDLVLHVTRHRLVT